MYPARVPAGAAPSDIEAVRLDGRSMTAHVTIRVALYNELDNQPQRRLTATAPTDFGPTSTEAVAWLYPAL